MKPRQPMGAGSPRTPLPGYPREAVEPLVELVRLLARQSAREYYRSLLSSRSVDNVDRSDSTNPEVKKGS
jgi:hypothetical protein